MNWADFPPVIALHDGSLAAHWLVKSGTGTYAYNVNIARSKDGGKTWSKSIVPFHGWRGSATKYILRGRNSANPHACDRKDHQRQERNGRYDDGRYGNDGYYDRDGRRNDGYNNDGYGNGSDVRQVALERGYQEGIRAGRDDRSRNRGARYENNSAYRDATAGYNNRYGNIDTYRSSFRDGFRQGYQKGYNGRYSNGNGSGNSIGNILGGIFGRP